MALFKHGFMDCEHGAGFDSECYSCEMNQLRKERDEWKCEAVALREKAESVMNLKHTITDLTTRLERSREVLEHEREAFTGRRRDKAAQWKELEAQRDAARAEAARLRSALESVRESLFELHSEIGGYGQVRGALLVIADALSSAGGTPGTDTVHVVEQLGPCFECECTTRENGLCDCGCHED